MIISLDELKTALGLDLDDTTQDTALTALIVRAGAWVEGETHRRFDTPELREDIVEGQQSRKLYLEGHIDPAAQEDESADVLAQLSVKERLIGDGEADWNDFVDGEDYERRNDVLYRLGAGNCWSRCHEYELLYLDGYVSAPDDIKALVTELAAGQYGVDQAVADGSIGITSEKIGDYSYSVDASITGAASASPGGGLISDIGQATVNRWRRKFV